MRWECRRIAAGPSAAPFLRLTEPSNGIPYSRTWAVEMPESKSVKRSRGVSDAS